MLRLDLWVSRSSSSFLTPKIGACTGLEVGRLARNATLRECDHSRVRAQLKWCVCVRVRACKGQQLVVWICRNEWHEEGTRDRQNVAVSICQKM